MCSETNMESFQKAKELGFNTFINLNNLNQEIDECIEAVLNESCFISSTMLKMIEIYCEITKRIATLSTSEKILLTELSAGKDPKDIANEMVLSSKSMSQMTNSICRKIDIPEKDKALMEWSIKYHSILN